MEIHLTDCGIQELFFGCTGERDIERQVYLKDNYELGSAFFVDPENENYSLVRVYLGRVNGETYLGLSTSTEGPSLFFNR